MIVDRAMRPIAYALAVLWLLSKLTDVAYGVIWTRAMAGPAVIPPTNNAAWLTIFAGLIASWITCELLRSACRRTRSR